MIAPTANTEQPGTFADTGNADNDAISTVIIDADENLNINIQEDGSERFLYAIALPT